MPEFEVRLTHDHLYHRALNAQLAPFRNGAVFTINLAKLFDGDFLYRIVLMDKHGQAIESYNVFLGLYTVLFLNFRLFRGLNRARN